MNSEALQGEVKELVEKKVKMRKKITFNLQNFVDTPVDELIPPDASASPKRRSQLKVYVLTENQKRRWNDIVKTIPSNNRIYIRE